MGLDMMLSVKKGVPGWAHRGPEAVLQLQKVCEAVGIQACTECPWATVEIDIAYWRKANQIHGWFIRECAAGDGNVTTIEISRQDLTRLRDLCRSGLEAKSEHWAMEHLPPMEGFFFGTYDIDEWYWLNVEKTVALLTAALNLPDNGDHTFHYRASW